MLIPVLMNKLPEEFKIISREFEKNVWGISKVLKIFKCELTAREKVTSQLDLGPQSDIPYSASNLFTSGQKFQKGTQGTDDKSKFKNMCIFCRRNHSSTRCDIVTDPKVRKQIIINDKRCFVSLRLGHNAKACQKN